MSQLLAAEHIELLVAYVGTLSPQLCQQLRALSQASVRGFAGFSSWKQLCRLTNIQPGNSE